MAANACHYPGAVQMGNTEVQSWSRPIFDAFLFGAWMLHWTKDTLFWIAKPTLHAEQIPNGKRFHNSIGPALESDLENLYFWHGVMVPAFAVTKPEWITLKHIQDENNAEVRRVLIERYGLSRYLLDSGAKRIAEDEFGEVYSTEILGDESLVMVKVMNSTPEPDGSFKPYFLRVNPELRPLLKNGQMGEPQKITALNAVASTFGMTGEQYLQRLLAQT
jgi:hypothetical protein